MATPSHPRPHGRSRDSARLLRQRESLREVIESISSELELRPLLTRIVAPRLRAARTPTHGIIGLYDDDHERHPRPRRVRHRRRTSWARR